MPISSSSGEPTNEVLTTESWRHLKGWSRHQNTVTNIHLDSWAINACFQDFKPDVVRMTVFCL
jgi:hypothetical protein